MGMYKIDNQEVTIEEFKSLLKTKTCSYRNCINSTNNKYCSRNCKNHEYTYVKRERIQQEKDKQRIIELLNQMNQLQDQSIEMVDLYKKIYTK
jgi:SLT domain-containing protein